MTLLLDADQICSSGSALQKHPGAYSQVEPCYINISIDMDGSLRPWFSCHMIGIKDSEVCVCVCVCVCVFFVCVCEIVVGLKPSLNPPRTCHPQAPVSTTHQS